MRRKKQPKDFAPVDNKLGHTLLLAGCLLIIIIWCLWALAEAFWLAAKGLP